MEARKRQRRFTADRDLRPIHSPSEVDLDTICRNHKINDKERDHLRKSLHTLASIAEAMRRDQMLQEKPSRQVREFRKLAFELKRAAEWLDQFDTILPLKKKFEVVDPVGLEALGRTAAANLCDVLSSNFVVSGERRKVSPDDGTAILTQDEIKQAIAANPGRVMWDLLLLLAKTYAVTANQIEAEVSRGPKRLLIIPMMLMNLAKDYHDLGRKPSKGRSGPFRRFVDDILHSMGMDPNPVDGQIARVIDIWKSRQTIKP